MPKARTLPKIARRRSKVHGSGVLALEAINKNTRIIDYAGELVRNDASEGREERHLAGGCIWVFCVNRRWIRASKPIRPGEELTYDDATDGELSIVCRCHPGCRNTF